MKVMLATDGSQHAEEAARLLAHLPHADKLELAVVYVARTARLQGAIVPVDVMQQYVAEERAQAESIFQHLSELFQGAHVSMELVVLEGHIGQTIVDEAEARQCDLIVLGAVGHSMFERMLGSVSDFVASRARCSVLLVRPTGLSTQKRPINLCFAEDGSPASAEAASQVAMFGWGATTHIDVAGVVASMSAYLIPETGRFIEQAVARAGEQLGRLSAKVETHVIEGNHAGDTLVDFAKRRGSDIIVLGNAAQDRLGNFFFGSTSRYVLRHANCSIWIARKRV
jgi:nucleotide-binding universal stress UspA family protein